MKAVPALLLACCGLLAQGPSSAPVTSRAAGVLTRAEAEAELDLLEAAIREKWSYLEDKEKNWGLDLAKLVAAAKARLEDVNSKAQFHANVLELVASLKDGHANVFTLGVARPQRRWPFRVEDASDGFVVVANTAGRPDLGDRIVGLVPPGRPRTTIEEELARIEKRTLASTDGARRRAALRALQETDAPLMTVQMKTRDGTIYAFAFDTIAADQAPAAALLEERFLEKGWIPSTPAPGVARFCVRTFTVEDWAGWAKAPVESREGFLTATKAAIDRCFAEIGKMPEADRKALVLDLRGNTGGTDLLGIHLAKHLLPKRFVYYALSAQREGKWTMPHGYEHDPVPSEQRFDGPLAILIDEDCFSVTDNFIRCLVENRADVITVGRPTNGGTGAPSVIAKLPRSGTSVTLCTMRVYGPKGGMIEGRGTTPAVPVRWTAEDFLKKRDPDLAAALEALGKAASRPK